MKKRPSARLLIVDRQQRVLLFHFSHHEIDVAGWSENERRVIDQSAWWTCEKLRHNKKRIFPKNIAERLSAIISAQRITPI